MDKKPVKPPMKPALRSRQVKEPAEPIKGKLTLNKIKRRLRDDHPDWDSQKIEQSALIIFYSKIY